MQAQHIITNQTDKVFYMVFLEGGNAPTVRHPSLADAEEEAARLTNKFARPAFVLEAVTVMTPEVRAIKRVLRKPIPVCPRPPSLMRGDF